MWNDINLDLSFLAGSLVIQLQGKGFDKEKIENWEKTRKEIYSLFVQKYIGEISKNGALKKLKKEILTSNRRIK